MNHTICAGSSASKTRFFDSRTALTGKERASLELIVRENCVVVGQEKCSNLFPCNYADAKGGSAVEKRGSRYGSC